MTFLSVTAADVAAGIARLPAALDFPIVTGAASLRTGLGAVETGEDVFLVAVFGEAALLSDLRA